MKTNFNIFWQLLLCSFLTQTLLSQATLKYVSDKNVRTYHFPKFFATDEYYFFCTFSADSISLDGKYYFKALSFKENDPSYDKHEPYFREENKMVFYKYLNEPEKLLYNFNLTIGDTLRDNYMGYYKVRKLDTITTDDGLHRKRFFLDKFCRNVIYGQAIWVEGLGNVETYEYRDACIIIDPEATFVCASNSGKVIYAPFFCQTVDVEHVDFHGFKFYPNPTSGTLLLEGDIDAVDYIQIFDILGNGLDQFKFNKLSKTINTENLKAGLYCLLLITNRGKRQLHKFVKI